MAGPASRRRARIRFPAAHGGAIVLLFARCGCIGSDRADPHPPMPKAFSLVSWNVEHFRNSGTRVADVVALLAELKPDVLALYEVEGADVFPELVKAMPKHQFHITEGPQVQEILVGVKGGLSAFFTQKLEFKSGNQALRPGALLTVSVAGANYPILFLHTKSGSTPIGWGIRDDMLERALDFRKVLDRASNGGRANYLFLGDLNTMGMQYLIKDRNVTAAVEIEKLDLRAAKADMRRLTKDSPVTWSNGSKSRFQPADLDQVVAASHLRFRSFGGSDVRVLGWPREATPVAQDAWIARYSDHALLHLEVQRV